MHMNHIRTHKGQDIFAERDYTTKLLNNVKATSDSVRAAKKNETSGNQRAKVSKDSKGLPSPSFARFSESRISSNNYRRLVSEAFI